MTLPSRMTVLVDAYPHVYGGAQLVLHQIGAELVRRGRPVMFMTTGPGPVPDRMREDGIEVVTITPPSALNRFGRTTVGWRLPVALLSLPVWWVRVARALRGRDVMHVDDHRGLILFGVGALLARVPIVWHVNSVNPNRRLNRLLSRLARTIIVPSPAVIERLPALDRSKVVLIENCLPDFIATLPAAQPSGSRVVTACRFHPDKGLDVLLEAAAHACTRVPDLVVDIYGEAQDGWASFADQLHARHEELGLAETVRFLGFHQNPARLWLDAALYVQPARSTTEVQPLAIIEAMAVGLPVVATSVGGIPELVEDGRTGLLVPENDAIALGDAMVALLSDPARVAEMGRAGRERMQQWPTAAAITDRVEEVYDTVTTGRARA